MKRMILIISILSIFILTAKGPDDNRLVIVQAEKTRPYEAVFNAVCKVESNNDPLAIGDRHLEEYSYGICQIRQVRLDHYFELTGIRYTVEDMFDPVKAEEIFIFFAHRIGPYDMEAISRCWNGGPNGMNIKSTEKYYLKVKKHL